MLLCEPRRTGRAGDDSLDLRGLHDCGVPVGWVVSQVMLAVLFYVMNTPVPPLFCWRGRDSLHRAPARANARVTGRRNPSRRICRDTSGNSSPRPDPDFFVSEPNQNDFEKTAKEQAEVGFFREFWGLLRDNKKWSLLPILIVLVLFSVLIIFSGTGLAPFIYMLF